MEQTFRNNFSKLVFLVEFTVSNNLDAAIRMWEQLTCIRFVARTPANMRQYNDYVTIQQTVDG